MRSYKIELSEVDAANLMLMLGMALGSMRESLDQEMFKLGIRTINAIGTQLSDFIPYSMQDFNSMKSLLRSAPKPDLSDRPDERI